MDNYGVSSVEVLHSVACTSTVHNGLSVSTYFQHLVEQLSVQLYQYNAKMILQFWSLHLHLENEYLATCSRLDEASHDVDTVVINGVGMVGCSVILSGSLDSSSADATDYVCYTIDVCNCAYTEYPSDEVQ